MREKAESASPSKMRKGRSISTICAEQLIQMEKIGGLGGIMGMLPGMAKMKDQIAAANLDDRVFKRQRAIIDSMTPRGARATRRSSRLRASAASRRAPAPRPSISTGCLKMHRQMADMMKAMGGAKGARWARWPRCSAWRGEPPARRPR